MGEVLQAQHDLTGALAEFRAESEVRSQLAQKYPDNADWQQELLNVHNKIGRFLKDQDDFAGAVQEFQTELTLAADLAAKDPAKDGWQREVGNGHSWVRRRAMGAGRPPGGLEREAVLCGDHDRTGHEGPRQHSMAERTLVRPEERR